MNVLYTFDIAQICLLFFFKSCIEAYRSLLDHGFIFQLLNSLRFFFFFFNENNNADIFNEAELILEIKWSIDLKKILLE